MTTNDTPITLTESDLQKPTKIEKPKEEIVISDELVHLVRSASPDVDWRLTNDIVDNICHNLAHGVPIEACAACVCVTPPTLKKWLEKGQQEVCSLTEEQLNSATNILDILSPYGRLFLRQAQAKGQLMATIMDAVYDKMFEENKEWLLTYMLERLDPSTFNLKYKTEMTKIEQSATNVNLGTQNFVNIQFVNGKSERPEEDVKFIDGALQSLEAKYAKKQADRQMVEVKGKIVD